MCTNYHLTWQSPTFAYLLIRDLWVIGDLEATAYRDDAEEKDTSPGRWLLHNQTRENKSSSAASLWEILILMQEWRTAHTTFMSAQQSFTFYCQGPNLSAIGTIKLCLCISTNIWYRICIFSPTCCFESSSIGRTCVPDLFCHWLWAFSIFSCIFNAPLSLSTEVIFFLFLGGGPILWFYVQDDFDDLESVREAIV